MQVVILKKQTAINDILTIAKYTSLLVSINEKSYNIAMVLCGDILSRIVGNELDLEPKIDIYVNVKHTLEVINNITTIVGCDPEYCKNDDGLVTFKFNDHVRVMVTKTVMTTVKTLRPEHCRMWYDGVNINGLVS